MNTLRHLVTATATALLMGAAMLAPAQPLNFAYEADPVSLDPHELAVRRHAAAEPHGL